MTTYGSNLSECHYYLLEVIGGEGEVDRIAQPPPPGTGTFSGCLATETDIVFYDDDDGVVVIQIPFIFLKDFLSPVFYNSTVVFVV